MDSVTRAYAGVVNNRARDVHRIINHTALAIVKMRVTLIKHLSIPHLKLCGTLLVTKLLLHCGKIVDVLLESTYFRTDSTVVLCWLHRDAN